MATAKSAPRAAKSATEAFETFTTASSEGVRENIDRSSITVTELADTLVREEGLPFRRAHEIAAEVARLETT